MRSLIVSIVAVLVLSACASKEFATAYANNSKAYYELQAKAMDCQPALLLDIDLSTQEGRLVEVGGEPKQNKHIKVYNPNLPCQMGNVQAPIPYDPNVETLKVVGGTVSSAVVPLVIGNTVKSLGNNIQAAGTAGYAYIQAPNTTTTTTTSTFTKTADNGSNIDGTQSNTVAPVTTTSTDNHAIDNHSNSSTVYNPVPLNMP